MTTNLPSPLTQAQSAHAAGVIAGHVKSLEREMLKTGFDRDVVRRELSFALAHLAAEYGLDPTGKR